MFDLGTDKERGLSAWKDILDVEDTDTDEIKQDSKEAIRRERLLETIYTLPICAKLLNKMPFLRFLPIYPR